MVSDYASFFGICEANLSTWEQGPFHSQDSNNGEFQSISDSVQKLQIGVPVAISQKGQPFRKDRAINHT
jgi:hypothetical protein